MPAIKKRDAQAAAYIFKTLWAAGAFASGMGGNAAARLDPFCKTGESRNYIAGYEQAMLAATCDILQKEGCVFPSELNTNASHRILSDFTTAIRTAKTLEKKGVESEEEDF